MKITEKNQLLKKKERVVKGTMGLLVVLLLCLLSVPVSKAALVADVVANWHDAGGWPSSLIPDYAGGAWLIYAQNDDQTVGKVISADAWMHPNRPQQGVIQAYDWDGPNPVGLQTMPAFSEYDSSYISANPWNIGEQPGPFEYRLYMIWTTGVTGPVNIAGEFKFIGNLKSSAMILQDDVGVLLPETILVPDNLLTPDIDESKVVFNVDTTVTTGKQVYFAIGTGITQYSDWQNETLFNAKINLIPEPMTIVLLSLGSLMSMRMRRNRTIVLLLCIFVGQLL